MHTLFKNISQLLGQVDPAAKNQQGADTAHPCSGSADMVMPMEDAALEKRKTQEVAISVVQPRKADDAITAAEAVTVSASFDTMSLLDPVTQVSYTLSPICTQCKVGYRIAGRFRAFRLVLCRFGTLAWHRTCKHLETPFVVSLERAPASTPALDLSIGPIRICPVAGRWAQHAGQEGQTIARGERRQQQ
eukprot:846905-Prorocentrum_minimum.AAC.1